jgi:hypothetical protein
MHKSYHNSRLAILFSASLVGVSLLGCKPEEERQKDAAALAQQEAAEAIKKAAPPMEDQVAKVGVGVKGDSLETSNDDPRGIITGPALALFKAKEKIVFEIQLPQAVAMYNALNGRNPKTHEEYMREIVEANKIPLPKLPDGMVYRYRPESNELWVESEKKK